MNIDKPWNLEPDFKKWVDPKSGLTCAVLRYPELWHLCGYFSKNRRQSYGGKKGISLALRHWVRDGVIAFPEYASFRGDPEIGRTVGDWQHVVRVLVAHEMAHWVQRSSAIVKPAGLDYLSSHGAGGFKEIYRFLRNKVSGRKIK